MILDEKESVRGFVLAVLDFVELPVSESGREPLRSCKSLSQLRAAASDMVAMCEDVTGQKLREMDNMLLEKGLPTLSEMRNRDLKRLRKILKAGRIESDDDWRLVECYLSNVDSRVLSAADRESANRILGAYELK